MVRFFETVFGWRYEGGNAAWAKLLTDMLAPGLFEKILFEVPVVP